MKKEALHIVDQRKQDHLVLTNAAQILTHDTRFDYEPVLQGNELAQLPVQYFAGKKLKAPIWISSMTGGTAKAGPINQLLAEAAGNFGLGMGLGSCRIILKDDTYLKDFQVRPYLGYEQPLFANIGIAQLTSLIASKELHLLNELMDKLEADGLFIHINPLQELMQEEGDTYAPAPIESLKTLLATFKYPVMVKEVGQGFGPKSLAALLDLPLYGLELAGHGGTNFTAMELMRQKEDHDLHALSFVGHSAAEMCKKINNLVTLSTPKRNSKKIIISGGVQNFLDGFYLMESCSLETIYGQASVMLNKANDGHNALYQYIEQQIKGLQIARQFLSLKQK